MAIAVTATAIALAPAASASPNALGAPTLSTRPTVAGMPTEGARLRAAPGSWTGSGKVRLAYQWFRCDTMGADCTALGGATRQTRLLGGHDVGHTIGLQVRATDSHGSTTADASLIGPVAGEPPLLSSRAQPVVSGAAAPGSTIRVDTGLWKPKPTSFSYQWVRCSVRAWNCAPIKGATSDQYAVESKDVGHSLLAVVQARAGAVSRAVFSVAAAPALAGDEPAGPANSAPPAVAEVIQQGSQLDRPRRHLVGPRSDHVRATSGTAATPRVPTASRSTGQPRSPIPRWPWTSGTRSGLPSAPPTRPGRQRPTPGSSGP